MVGDFQTGDLDIAGIAEVEYVPRPFAAPQLGRIGAAAIPALAQNAGGVGRIGAAGDGRHVAIPGIVGLAVIGSGRVVAHFIAALGDDEGVSAINARCAIGREGAERVIPGAVLGRAAVRVRRVRLSGALCGRSAIGTDVPGDGGLCVRTSGQCEQNQSNPYACEHQLLKKLHLFFPLTRMSNRLLPSLAGSGELWYNNCVWPP